MTNSLTKAEREYARERISQYHQKKLRELLKPVIEAIDDFKVGKIDAFELDERIHREQKQAQELYTFINRYYDSNDRLPMLLQYIDEEERGEWKWEPKRRNDRSVSKTDKITE